MKRGSFFNPMPTAALQRLSIVSARPKGGKRHRLLLRAADRCFSPSSEKIRSGRTMLRGEIRPRTSNDPPFLLWTADPPPPNRTHVELDGGGVSKRTNPRSMKTNWLDQGRTEIPFIPPSREISTAILLFFFSAGSIPFPRGCPPASNGRRDGQPCKGDGRGGSKTDKANLWRGGKGRMVAVTASFLPCRRA